LRYVGGAAGRLHCVTWRRRRCSRRSSGGSGSRGRRCCRGATRGFRRGCRSGCVRRKPLLNTLVAAACTRLFWSIGVTAVFALPSRASRRSGGSLRATELTYAKSQSKSDDVALNLHPTPPSLSLGERAGWLRRHHSKANREDRKREDVDGLKATVSHRKRMQ
jgi:hypothetical protein